MRTTSEHAIVQHTDRRQAQLAGELHDEVGATLSGALLLIALLRARAAPADLPQLALVLQEVQRAADGLRRVSRRMLAAGGEHGGLPAALEHLAAESARAGCRCTFRARGDCGQIDADRGGHLYRIAQEALANAVRHGHASRVRTMLACLPGRCRLTLDDDGRGGLAPDPRAEGGVGLRSIRVRVQVMDGLLEITRSPLGGWRLRVTVEAGHGPAGGGRRRLRGRKPAAGRSCHVKPPAPS